MQKVTKAVFPVAGMGHECGGKPPRPAGADSIQEGHR